MVSTNFCINEHVQFYCTNLCHHENGVMCVKVRGFKDHVDNAVSKIKTYLYDNVETKVQLPISKAMTIFLRT